MSTRENKFLTKKMLHSRERIKFYKLFMRYWYRNPKKYRVRWEDRCNRPYPDLVLEEWVRWDDWTSSWREMERLVSIRTDLHEVRKY